MIIATKGALETIEDEDTYSRDRIVSPRNEICACKKQDFIVIDQLFRLLLRHEPYVVLRIFFSLFLIMKVSLHI